MIAPPSRASAEMPSAGLISGVPGKAKALEEKQSAIRATGIAVFKVFNGLASNGSQMMFKDTMFRVYVQQKKRAYGFSTGVVSLWRYPFWLGGLRRP
jgi:hypothetical protein